MTYSEINPPPVESLADYGPQPDWTSSDFAGAEKIESSQPNGQLPDGLVEVPGVGFFDPAVARTIELELSVAPYAGISLTLDQWAYRERAAAARLPAWLGIHDHDPLHALG